MSHELVGAIGVGLMLILMFAGVPIAVAMIVVGLAGAVVLLGGPAALSLTGITVPSSFPYLLSVLPIFLLMGELADISGLMRDAYGAAHTWLGNLRGGLAMASIFGAAAFSAVSGSSTACAALMTRVSLPSLIERKYSPTLTTGALAAGGTLGNLIPPGNAFVFYALMSDTSIGKLFTAAILPGILLTVMYMVQIYIQCRLNPSLGPCGGSSTFKQKLFAGKGLVPLTLLFLLVMGGIYFGVFTPTEAGAIGTAGVFGYALIKRSVNGQSMGQAFKATMKTTGMVFAVIIGAQIFTYFIAIAGLAQALTDWVTEINLGPLGVIIAIMVVYFILGTAMDTLSMILLTLPIFVSIVSAVGIDLIWFGILVIIQMELSNITPPVGMNLFVVSNMVRERGISMGTVFRGVMPFCLTMLVFTGIIIAFPQISLFLPSHMK